MVVDVGFIGLGNMGFPMAMRLVEAGHRVRAFDLDGSRLAAAVARGAVGSSSAADVASQSEILLTSLPRPDHVQSVMVDSGALASLRTGSVWVDLTTNRRELVVDLARRAPEGVSVIDCPVTGAVDGARHGRLTLFAGGDGRVLESVRPVLEVLGKVIHCGQLGTGNVVKLVTNQLWFVAAAALGEGFAVGLANGVDLATLWGALKDSVGDSFVVRHDAPSIFAGHYDPSFTLGLCEKDLALIGELARNVEANLPMTTAATAAFSLARERYGTDAAELHVAKRIEDDAGLSMRLEGDWTPPWES